MKIDLEFYRNTLQLCDVKSYVYFFTRNTLRISL